DRRRDRPGLSLPRPDPPPGQRLPAHAAVHPGAHPAARLSPAGKRPGRAPAGVTRPLAAGHRPGPRLAVPLRPGARLPGRPSGEGGRPAVRPAVPALRRPGAALDGLPRRPAVPRPGGAAAVRDGNGIGRSAMTALDVPWLELAIALPLVGAVCVQAFRD